MQSHIRYDPTTMTWSPGAPDSPVVRVATPADSLTLTRLRAALFDELRMGAGAEGAQAFERACAPLVDELIGQGRAFAWLAETPAGATVATVTLLVYPRLPTPQDLRAAEGYLIGVWTAPEWRRRGIGRALVAEAIARARALGLARVRLHATEDGRPLYSSLGFAPKPSAMELRLD